MCEGKRIILERQGEIYFVSNKTSNFLNCNPQKKYFMLWLGTFGIEENGKQFSLVVYSVSYFLLNQNAGFNCNQLKMHCKGSLKIIAQESVYWGQPVGWTW